MANLTFKTARLYTREKQCPVGRMDIGSQSIAIDMCIKALFRAIF